LQNIQIFILTPKSLLEFCQTIPNIKSFFVPKSARESARFALESRYKMETTIRGTRWFHHFESISSKGIQLKRTSADARFSGSTCLKNIPNSPRSKVKNNDYRACIYDSVWWIGSIMEVDELQS